MIEKNIRALKDFELRTFVGVHSLTSGEVKSIRFKNQQTFEGLLEYDNFVEVRAAEKEVKVIPVILPPKDENVVVEHEQELPFVEAIQDDNNLDEAGEPTGEQTLEDSIRDEPPQTEKEIDYRDITGARLTDTPDTFNEEELTPEQETEGLVEVEEIPIEEQDEDKSKLKSDEVVNGQ